ncbi:MAG: hypothetical protein ABI947_12480 [Chloroflexota bacterium]
MDSDVKEKFQTLALRYGVSVGAVEALAYALRTSGGKQAQFSHPELGGMGQWQPGMMMIGDLFNTALKARVDGLATELSQLIAANAPTVGFEPLSGFTSGWWPSSFGAPNSAGGQNDLYYAYFASHNRLLIKRQGQIAIYDTTGHRVGSVSQQQMNGVQIIVFNSEAGLADISTLPIVL